MTDLASVWGMPDNPHGHFAGHADYANILPYQQQPSPPGPNATRQELQKVRDPKADQSSINKKVVVTGTQTEMALTLPLVEGSRVQIPCSSPGEPFKYGVIRWIGDVREVQGLVAGIELVR
jgi:hypothetical protein